MPELPEVETVRLGLSAALEGRRIGMVRVRRTDLRFPVPAGLASALAGRRVLRVGRRGKFLLIALDSGLVLISHLGMSGRFRIFAGPAPPVEPHDHVEFTTDAGTCLRYNDPRRFGFMMLCDEGRLGAHPMLSRLGPEPLGPDFDGPALADRLRGRVTPVKLALADQRVVAGLGNIYVSESLFWAGLSPRRRAGTVVGRRAGRLAAAIRDVLESAIAAGGSSLRDHRRPSGELGYFQHRLAVYGRAGEACPGCSCDRALTGGIGRIVQSGRSTFYCPVRQR